MGIRKPLSSGLIKGESRRQIGVVKGGHSGKDLRNFEAGEKNAALQKKVHALETILEFGLARDPHVSVGDWRPGPTDADLPEDLRDRPRPDPAAYAVQPLGILERVVPGAAARHSDACRQAEARLADAIAEWEAFQARRTEALAALQADIGRHNQQLEEIEARFTAGDPATVRWYVERVLEKSPYPRALTRRIEVGYNVALRTIRVTIALPCANDVVPAAQTYKFSKQRGEIVESERSPEERAALYKSIVAQVTLRTLYEVFTTDSAGRFDAVSLLIDELAADPVTGKDKVEKLARLRVERAAFIEIDLTRVEPIPCFKHLKKLSRDVATASSADSQVPDDLL